MGGSIVGIAVVVYYLFGNFKRHERVSDYSATVDKPLRKAQPVISIQQIVIVNVAVRVAEGK